jgi:CBS domain-containing protein
MSGPRDEVRTIEWPEPISVDAHATLRVAAAALDRCAVGALVVVGPGGDVGVLSERDIVAALAAGADVDTARAGDIATRHLVTAAPSDRLDDVARRALGSGVRHVLVVDDDDVVGVVSMRDLLAVFVAA